MNTRIVIIEPYRMIISFMIQIRLLTRFYICIIQSCMNNRTRQNTLVRNVFHCLTISTFYCNIKTTYLICSLNLSNVPYTFNIMSFKVFFAKFCLIYLHINTWAFICMSSKSKESPTKHLKKFNHSHTVAELHPEYCIIPVIDLFGRLRYTILHILLIPN